MSAGADHPLPFTEEMQEAIVGYSLTDVDFFIKCNKRLRGNWFTKNINLGVIFDQLKFYYAKHREFIRSIDEFKAEPFFLEQKNSDKHKFYTLIDRSVASSRNFNLQNVERKLTGFMRLSLFKESIEGAALRYKSQGFDDAYIWTKAKLGEIQDATFEDQDVVLRFANPEKWVEEQKKRKSQSISTGNALLDQALGGGLFKSETCAFMAPSNVGKTTAMITLARHAVKNKQNVLFIIHEGNPKELRLRILSAFLGVKTETLYTMDKQIVKAASEYIDQYLTYAPYIKTNAMYVEDVVDFIKAMHKEKLEKNGKGFDLIINDYPKKLKSRIRTGQKEGLYRVEASEIYDAFNHLATELDVHCFVAIQTNRTGLKQNNGKIESDFLLGMEEVDEAYGIAQNLANIITLNRSPEDKARRILRFNVAKSRNSPTDICINTRTSYECCLAFGDKDMFDNNGMWQMDIPMGFLSSEMQPNNSKFATDAVDNSLREKEKITITLPDNGTIGAFTGIKDNNL